MVMPGMTIESLKKHKSVSIIKVILIDLVLSSLRRSSNAKCKRNNLTL